MKGTTMDKSGSRGQNGERRAKDRRGDGPGSETERFRAIVDLRYNERVTGESGVPYHQRDHEARRQLNSLDEFS
jgi:hypothetical protein